MKIAGEKTVYEQKLAQTPNYLMIEPTNKCNLKCKMCSREELKDIGDMDYDSFEKVMKQLPGIKTIKFQGLGEAYLAKDAMRMLLYCKQKNIDVVSITNCLWKNINIEELMPLLKHMYISYHAADEETYGEICGVEGKTRSSFWELLHKNIEKIVASKGNCEVLLNCVISSINYYQAPEIVKRAKSLGVNHVRFQIMQNWTTEGEELFDNLASVAEMDENLLINALKKAYQLARELDISIELVGNSEFEFTHCIWPFERTYINRNGDVLTCHMRPAPEYKIGNVFEKTFEEIWNGDKLNTIRELLSQNNPPEMCCKCPYIENADVLRRIKQKLGG